MTLETNQNALNALLREVLPDGWQIVKGPAIYRDQKRLAVTASPPTSQGASEIIMTSDICTRFHAISGWDLGLTEPAQPVYDQVSAVPTGRRMEINAAYAFIKSALDGSTLYRTSLKDDEIVLSFISRQLAERYQSKIAELAGLTGWPLSVNPQPNQGAILIAARAMLAKAGLVISKGPSIYPEKAEVSVVLKVAPTEKQETEIAETFMSETGFRLVLMYSSANIENTIQTNSADVVEIPLGRICLSGYQQSLSLDPDKLEKAIERARQMGITPPIRVRRARDGYLLSDGLYRLRAAEALGLERVPAVVE